MSDDLVYRSFERVAERAVDITPKVYQKFFARHPEAESLMGHIDQIVRGRMMDEVYRLLLADDFSEEQQYLNWEVTNHRTAYNVEFDMYPHLMEALVDAVKESMGDDWNADYEDAWAAKNELLMQEVHRRYGKIR